MTKHTKWTDEQHNEAMKAVFEAQSLYPFPTHSTVAPFQGVRWASTLPESVLWALQIEDPSQIAAQGTSAITGPVIPTDMNHEMLALFEPKFTDGVTLTFNDIVKMQSKTWWQHHGGMDNIPDCIFTPMGVAWHEYGHVLAFANGVFKEDIDQFEGDLRHIALMHHYGIDYEEVKSISTYSDQGGPSECFGDLNAILHCESNLLSKDISVKAAYMYRDLGHGECPQIHVSREIRDHYTPDTPSLSDLFTMLMGTKGGEHLDEYLQGM